MSAKNLVLPLAVAAFVAGAAAGYLGRPAPGPGASPAPAAGSLEREADDNAKLRAEIATLKAEEARRDAEFAQRDAASQERLVRLQRAIDELEPAGGTATASVQATLRAAGARGDGSAAGAGAGTGAGSGASGDAKAKKLAVDFGKWSKLDAISGADWAEMGGAARAIGGYIPDILDKLKNGEELPTDVQVAIAQENMKLQKFAFQAMGKLPTQTTGGEFTHPIALANLMAAELAQAGLPLSEQQASDIGALGDEYDVAWEQAQSSYGDDTPKLQEVLDELELKHKFVDAMQALLTPDQRALIVVPGVHDVQRLDLHSPVLMVIGLGHPFAGATKAALRDQVVQWTTTTAPSAADKMEAVNALADRWLVDIDAALAPTTSEMQIFYTYDQADVSARAVLRFRVAMAQELSLDDATKKKILGDAGFGVPRLVPAATTK